MIDRVFIQAVSKASGVEIKIVQEIPNTELFDRLSKELTILFKKEPYNRILRFFEKDMNTIVETPKGGVLKVHNSLDIHFVDGSVIRFSPDKEDGLELTRIKLPEKSRGRGLGKDYMDLTLTSFQHVLGYVPRIVLECTGAIGVAENYEELSLDSQVGFFEKLDFVLVEYDSKVGYARMERPRGKVV
jgi:ribosomal protein S18 acetylase RimI-like enzyme